MKKINICFISIFLIVIFGFSAAFAVVPDKDISEEENRSLAKFPDFSLENLISGNFTAEMNTYFADQFVARNELVGIKSVAELLLCKGENNGVLLGKNGQLAVKNFDVYKSVLDDSVNTDYYYKENIEVMLSKYNEYADNVDLPLTTVLPPRTIDVAASAFNYPDTNSKNLSNLINNTISKNASYIDLVSEFQKRYNDGEYIYYKTDHHWTSLGAYYAYCSIMENWGMADSIISKEQFKIEKINSFYGTTWSKSGMKFINPDIMEIWSLGNEDEFETNCYYSKKVKNDKGEFVSEKVSYKNFDGWINREHLTTKNKYASFLDGTHNEQTVFKKTGEKRERLLIAKDSFADSLVPFLAQHFDLVVVNLSNNMVNLSDYIREYGCDRVLVVYNFENIISDSNIAKIK